MRAVVIQLHPLIDFAKSLLSCPTILDLQINNCLSLYEKPGILEECISLYLLSHLL